MLDGGEPAAREAASKDPQADGAAEPVASSSDGAAASNDSLAFVLMVPLVLGLGKVCDSRGFPHNWFSLSHCARHSHGCLLRGCLFCFLKHAWQA